MRILIASDLYWPAMNGIPVVGRNLARGLAAAGHEVIVVAPSETTKRYTEIDGTYKIMRTTSVALPFYQNQHVSLSPAREITKIVRSFKPDIIHVQTALGIGSAALSVAKRHKIPVLATNHVMPENLVANLKLLAPFARQVRYLLYRYGVRFYGRADYVTAPTEAAIKMQKPGGFDTPHSAVSNGIDLKAFQPGTDSKLIRKKYAIPQNKPVVLYIGRLDPEKHVATLLQAASLIKKLEAHFVIVGGGSEREKLETLTNTLGIRDCVTFTGLIPEDEKIELLHSSNVFAMPSPTELQCVAALEAMATGLPLVVADAGALPELCQLGRNGIRFPTDDAQAMGEAISALLLDPDLARKYGIESLAIAGQHSLDATIKKYELLYDMLIAQRHATTPSGARV